MAAPAAPEVPVPPTAPASNPLLRVTSALNPERFTVSSAHEAPKLGSLTLTFSKPAGTPAVSCSTITVTLPVGAGATDLVNDNSMGSVELIDDYPRDSTGAEWTILRTPAAALPSAPWGSQPGAGFENIFDPDDARFYRTQYRVMAGTSLVVDYGTTQPISTIDVGTGRPDEHEKVPPLDLEWSEDGSWWNLVERCMDTFAIHKDFNPPLQARFLRLHALWDGPVNTAVVRHFLINESTRSSAVHDHVTFVCTPPGGETVFDDDREFTLILANIPVNHEVGSAPVTVTETTADGSEWVERPLPADPVDKASSDFVFENFSCEQPRIQSGQKPTFHWNGSPENTEYYLHWDDQSAIVTVPPTGYSSYTLDVPLTRTTTFVLDAQTLNGAQRTVSHYRSTTVTVKDADITAKTLTATDEIVLTDAAEDTFRAGSEGARTWARDTTLHGDVHIS
jgi:hypothetical protein